MYIKVSKISCFRYDHSSKIEDEFDDTEGR